MWVHSILMSGEVRLSPEKLPQESLPLGCSPLGLFATSLFASRFFHKASLLAFSPQGFCHKDFIFAYSLATSFLPLPLGFCLAASFATTFLSSLLGFYLATTLATSLCLATSFTTSFWPCWRSKYGLEGLRESFPAKTLWSQSQYRILRKKQWCSQ